MLCKSAEFASLLLLVFLEGRSLVGLLSFSSYTSFFYFICSVFVFFSFVPILVYHLSSVYAKFGCLFIAFDNHILGCQVIVTVMYVIVTSQGVLL